MIEAYDAVDGLTLRTARFLEEIARERPVRLHLPSDKAWLEASGAPPRFPLEERRYLAESLRWVDEISVTDAGVSSSWARAEDCASDLLAEVPAARARSATPVDAPIVFATGCYDWLHSGHVRFFEEASGMGALFVTVGNDASVAAFKGPGHPMFPATIRRYLVGSVRHVHTALIASGDGWLDATSEIREVRPTLCVVNQDGDRPEKRAFCEREGIEYRVLERRPRPGLEPRTSTQLRGY